MRGRRRPARRARVVPGVVAAAFFLGWLGVGVREAASGMAPNGTSCAATSDCQSGFCVDAVCCDSACNAPSCSACSVTAGATADGTCTPLDGTPCDNHDACTQTDTCKGGVCVGSTPVVCQATDDCHEAVCDLLSGACVQPKKADGTPCDDHDVCTQNDTCLMGSCVGGTTVVCVPQDACHAAGVCDPQTGCTNPVLPNCGTPPLDGGGPLADAGALPDGGAGPACSSTCPPDVAGGSDGGCACAPTGDGSPVWPAGVASALLLTLGLRRRVSPHDRRLRPRGARAGAGPR